MNIYEINTHDFQLGHGQQTIAARNAGEALHLFARSKDGEALLDKTTGLEIRIFKSNSGVVLSSSFDNPNCQSRCCEAVPPPPMTPQPEPATAPPAPDIGTSFLANLISMMIARSKTARNPKRKKS